MKERPILFKGRLVRRILANAKTQTRRIVNLRDFGPSSTKGYDWDFRDRRGRWNSVTTAELLASTHNRYGAAGDRLWVRESIWCRNETCDHEYCAGCDLGSLIDLGADYAQVQYVATPECCDPPELQGAEVIDHDPNHEHGHGHWWLGPPDDWNGEDYERGVGKWGFIPTRYSTMHPSIHMPRWASRLSLDVVSVGIERLQDITEADAIAEGVDISEPWDMLVNSKPAKVQLFNHRDAFAYLWNTINGERRWLDENGVERTFDASWKANPYVWCVSFKRAAEENTEAAA